VFGTNTSTGTYLAFWPYGPLDFLPLPRKREYVQTIRSFSYAL